MVQAGRRAFSPGLGWLTIDAVDVVELHAMNDRDALADGFATVADMIDLLKQLYPAHATDDKMWFRVRFRLESPPTDSVPSQGQAPQLELPFPDFDLRMPRH